MNDATPLASVIAEPDPGLAPVMVNRTAWPAIGLPRLSTRVAVKVCELPGTFGPAMVGASWSRAPKRTLWTCVVKELVSGP